MNVRRRTPAEDTAAILRDAVQAGVTIPIPGAREARAAVVTSSSARHAPMDALSIRQRLEAEREGGGAPSQRRPASERTPIATLVRWLTRRPREPEHA
ncbi:MAG: hypothetical protein DMG03_07650 [Acidobacteria bacterium]|nr:MAG: hypothetical protein DMG03_07650 [Acidobacteriota bacterium]